MSDDERLAPLALGPETASLDCGTINFGGDDYIIELFRKKDIEALQEFLKRRHWQNIFS